VSAYRFLQDSWIGGAYYLAGTVASTSDVGGSLPANWVPSNAVDPLDAAGAQAMWSAGPKLLGLVRQQWSSIPVNPPATFWIAGPAAHQWSLTGLGGSLGPLPGEQLGRP
jgi:hypothetical protein